MAYDNELSGALFKNDKQNDKQPDYTGTCEIGGTEYQIASWIKKSQKGTTYMSLKFQTKDDRQRQAPRGADPRPAPPAAPASAGNPDDEIPF